MSDYCVIDFTVTFVYVYIYNYLFVLGICHHLFYMLALCTKYCVTFAVWCLFFTAGDTGEAESEPSVQRAALLELTSHTDTLTAADWMAGGTRIITASWDRSAILHDAESGDVISMLTGDVPFRCFVLCFYVMPVKLCAGGA